MSHTFDSGLPKPQYTIIRDAIEDALADLLKSATPAKYVATVVRLPAPVTLKSEDAVNLEDAVRGKCPAVAVAIGSRDFESVGTDNNEWHGPVEIHVYACTSHARGLVDGRLVADAAALADDTKDPGLDIMGEHVFERLAGLPIDEFDAELRPRRRTVEYVGGDFTVEELLFELDLCTNTNPSRDRSQVVTEIETTHEEAAAGTPAALVAVTELDP